MFLSSRHSDLSIRYIYSAEFILFFLYKMKRVSIFGKKNTDALHPERQAKRSATENWPNQDYIFDSAQQVNIVNQLWMDQQFAGCENVRREIANKLSGYRNQDKKKGLLDSDTFISYADLMDKLVVSRLRCYYCRTPLLVAYQNVRDKNQWTLDRLDNNIGHSNQNTVVAGLECNLRRRKIDDKKFLFTRQMRLIKKN